MGFDIGANVSPNEFSITAPASIIGQHRRADFAHRSLVSVSIKLDELVQVLCMQFN